MRVANTRRLLLSCWFIRSIPLHGYHFVSYTLDSISSLHIYNANVSFFSSCVNLLAVLLWSLSTDYLGRRMIINTCQTLVCFILFIVGGVYYAGATSGNAAAGTGLVSPFTLVYLLTQ